jgi:N-acetylglucosamine kinase-like BadF-type ATPase
METYAAVDGGKSALRLAVGGPEGIRYAEAPGFGYAPGQDDVATIVESVRQAAGQLAPLEVDRVCAGLTGAPGDPAELDRLRRALAAVFGAGDVAVVPDVFLAHAGAVDGPGVVVCAGTGTAVFALGSDGRTAALDAWGPVIGDRGSGWSVGMAGLRAAAAAIDGVGPTTSLASRMGVALGGTDLAALQALYSDPRLTARVAGFAEEVAAAAQAGDEVACRIWRDAAVELAKTATTAATRAGLGGDEARVSWAGRLFAAGDLVLEPFRAEVSRAGLVVIEPRGDALDGGLRLAAAGPDSIYQKLLNRSRR